MEKELRIWMEAAEREFKNDWLDREEIAQLRAILALAQSAVEHQIGTLGDEMREMLTRMWSDTMKDLI